MGLGDVVADFRRNYAQKSTAVQRVLDVYLVFLLLVAGLQLGYCVLVGTFPFNSFLSGFIAAAGAFVLTVSLRMQLSEVNASEFGGRSFERAFADYIVANIMLFAVVFTYMGARNAHALWIDFVRLYVSPERDLRPLVDIAR